MKVISFRNVLHIISSFVLGCTIRKSHFNSLHPRTKRKYAKTVKSRKLLLARTSLILEKKRSVFLLIYFFIFKFFICTPVEIENEIFVLQLIPINNRTLSACAVGHTDSVKNIYIIYIYSFNELFVKLIFSIAVPREVFVINSVFSYNRYSFEIILKCDSDIIFNISLFSRW